MLAGAVFAAVADLPALDPEAVCTALCMQESLCNGTTVSPSCVEGCLEPPGAPPISGECFAASVAYSACLGALDCEERKDPYACEDALRLVLAPCRVCWSNAEVKDDGTCWFHEVCPEWTHHLECDADRCTCAVDGDVIAVCLQKGCDPLGFDVAYEECCYPLWSLHVDLGKPLREKRRDEHVHERRPARTEAPVTVTFERGDWLADPKQS